MIGGMGMKNKNVLFAVLGIIVLVVLVIGIFYHLEIEGLIHSIYLNLKN